MRGGTRTAFLLEGDGEVVPCAVSWGRAAEIPSQGGQASPGRAFGQSHHCSEGASPVDQIPAEGRACTKALRPHTPRVQAHSESLCVALTSCQQPSYLFPPPVIAKGCSSVD